MCQQLACLRWWKVTRVTFIWLVFPLTLTAIVFLIFLFATYQAHRLLTSGLKAHKVVHASFGSRFGQQDLYLPILIEILMIYFFQYGSFGGSVSTEEKNPENQGLCSHSVVTTKQISFLFLVRICCSYMFESGPAGNWVFLFYSKQSATEPAV